LRKILPLIFVTALAVWCRAQEQPAVPMGDADAPVSAPATPATQALPGAPPPSFRAYLKQLYSVRALTSTLPAALVEQVHDWPDQWGRDRLGFEKRVASLYGQFVIGVGLEDSVKAFHYEDTRYRRRGHGNFFRRVAYVVENTYTARSRDGSRTPAWSLAANAYGSWGIATLWSPRQYRTAESIAEWGSSGMAAFAVTNLAREYWPDIKRIFHRPKTNQACGSEAPPCATREMALTSLR